MAADNLNAAAQQIFPETTAEDEARAGVYAVLGALLRDVPDAGLLAQVRALPPAEARDQFALAWEGLRLAALQVSPGEVNDEYHLLFIGLGRGELVPYGSWYQTGFLMETPLGVLRDDLRALGYERRDGVHEPEDHVAALCEVMAAMAADPNIPVERQRDFYQSHLGPWVSRFWADLGAAESAVFYRAVAGLGGAFDALEARYLDMEV